MTILEIKRCKEEALRKNSQTLRDFNERTVLDMRVKGKKVYTTEDKVVTFLWARCVNLNGRINAKKFNQCVNYLVENVELI